MKTTIQEGFIPAEGADMPLYWAGDITFAKTGAETNYSGVVGHKTKNGGSGGRLLRVTLSIITDEPIKLIT